MRKNRVWGATVVGAGMLVCASSSLQAADTQSLSLQSALLLAQTTIDKCKTDGAAMVSVVDAAGVLKVALVADGAAGNPATAQRKAATAAAFGQSGNVMEAREKTDPEFAAQIAAQPEQYNAHGGSMPLMNDGVLKGGVGVTGIHPHDTAQACVDAALAALEGKLQ